MSAEPLRWEEWPDARSVFATLEPGGFYHVTHFACDVWSAWACGTIGLGRYRRTLGPTQYINNLLYEGDSESDAYSAVAAHRAATARAAAWERYMAENDPPSNGQE
ncbi:hypothetical protein MASS_1555 [Mycobacteroides abscessus subsp. bolletii 50594]|uniref:Bacteriophage protein n=1 Tax=Mycobacteroides abscessus subsp. bolletii 50594 TaxID=1303024 RepID=A0AB33A8K4_9MYCO|nr:hypothetical protein MASS_1555 [Mycobacteroides abscessus subsp. bolletii 50594]